jgi:hypothetical protein
MRLLATLMGVMLLLLVGASASAFLTPGSLGTVGGGGCVAPKMTGNGATIDLTVPHPVVSGVSVNGQLNVQAYGAKGDGVHDDTAAIQAAITDGMNNNVCVYFPSTASYYLVTSTLNATSHISAPVCLKGDNMRQTPFLFQFTDTTKVGIDATGTMYDQISNLLLQSHSGTSPRIMLLLGRAAASSNSGFSQLSHLGINTQGPIALYDYGHENDTLYDMQIFDGGPNMGQVIISAANTLGITSDYEPLITPPTSMLGISFIGSDSSIVHDTGCGITLDEGTSVVYNIGFYNTWFAGYNGGPAICDNTSVGGGQIEYLTLNNVREEEGTAGAFSLFNINGAAEHLKIDGHSGGLSAATHDVMTFNNILHDSDISWDEASGLGGHLLINAAFPRGNILRLQGTGATPLNFLSAGFANTSYANVIVSSDTAGNAVIDLAGNLLSTHNGVANLGQTVLGASPLAACPYLLSNTAGTCSTPGALCYYTDSTAACALNAVVTSSSGGTHKGLAACDGAVWRMATCS